MARNETPGEAAAARRPGGGNGGLGRLLRNLGLMTLAVLAFSGAMTTLLLPGSLSWGETWKVIGRGARLFRCFWTLGAVLCLIEGVVRIGATRITRVLVERWVSADPCRAPDPRSGRPPPKSKAGPSDRTTDGGSEEGTIPGLDLVLDQAPAAMEYALLHLSGLVLAIVAASQAYTAGGVWAALYDFCGWGLLSLVFLLSHLARLWLMREVVQGRRPPSDLEPEPEPEDCIKVPIREEA